MMVLLFREEGTGEITCPELNRFPFLKVSTTWLFHHVKDRAAVAEEALPREMVFCEEDSTLYYRHSTGRLFFAKLEPVPDADLSLVDLRNVGSP